jgi:hypothetical protein
MPEKELTISNAIYAFQGHIFFRSTGRRSHRSMKSRFFSYVKQKMAMNATMKCMVTQITILH